jgi:tetratricopeptide (TPR) repeat protein
MPPKPTSAALLAALLTLAALGTARSEPATNNVHLARAEKAFAAAQQSYRAETNAITAWQFGQACFQVAELATNNAQRAATARLGIAACRQAINQQTNSAPAHYYLATNLGELAQAEAPSLAAYKLVHEVEREFKAAADLDVRFDHAGPARSLGELYYQAPGWPLSVGSNRKAREWFERAVALAPDYPANHLDLAEAQLKWRQREELESSLNKIDAIWPAAQTNFTGETWDRHWADWEVRRAALKAGYHRTYHPKS